MFELFKAQITLPFLSYRISKNLENILKRGSRPPLEGGKIHIFSTLYQNVMNNFGMCLPFKYCRLQNPYLGYKTDVNEENTS